MKKLIVYFLSFVLTFNYPASASSVKKYLNLNFDICDRYDKFYEFIACVEKIASKSSQYKNSFEYRKNSVNFMNINFVYDDFLSENIINKDQAFSYFNKLLNSNIISYKKKIDIEKTIRTSKCLNDKIFSEFINCFNNEFRDYPIYQNNNLINKFRFEETMFNMIMNSKGNLIVFVDIDGNEIEFDNNSGFRYFELMMEKIALNYFVNNGGIIESDIDPYVVIDKTEALKNILIFIIATVLISYIANKAVTKIVGKISSSSSSSAISSSTSASSSTASSSGEFLPGLFRNAPKNSILRKKVFKQALVSGRIPGYGFLRF